MKAKSGKIVTLAMALSVGAICPAPAAEGLHILSAIQRDMDPSTTTVNAAYYAATGLSVVDPDLAVGKIKAGVAIFGTTGTYAGGGLLPDTGQTSCYDAGGLVILCPAHGASSEQDASYNPAATQPNYTNNGDFTLTDSRTGLMWKKCSEGQNNDATCTGTAGLYAWTAALAQCTGLTDPGGYTDWRLPNAGELSSIVNSQNSNPCVNTTYFPNTAASYYWTSTTYVPYSSYAWYVNFYYGYVKSSNKTTNYYVRCVRGGP
jgi:hypothetical protein